MIAVARIFASPKARRVAAGLAIVAIAALAIWMLAGRADRQADARVEEAQEAGRASEREQGQSEVLNSVEAANGAVLRPDPNRDQRLRNRFGAAPSEGNQ